MAQSGRQHRLMIVGEIDSDTDEPPVDPQSQTQSTRADQEEVTGHTTDVETPCKSETHEPNVEKQKDSLVQTEEKVSKRRDMNKFVTRQTSTKRRRGRLYVILYAIHYEIKESLTIYDTIHYFLF